jgi:hypothetical protein
MNIANRTIVRRPQAGVKPLCVGSGARRVLGTGKFTFKNWHPVIEFSDRPHIAPRGLEMR